MTINFIPAAPSRPENLSVRVTDKTSVTLEWSKPKSDGGSRLRRYIIWRRVEMTDNWVKVTSLEHYTTKTVVEKLEYEKNFFFAVSAENDVGESDKAVTTEPVRLPKPSGVYTGDNSKSFNVVICTGAHYF